MQPAARPEAHLTSPQSPSKPHPNFPLYAHASRRWAKKVRGRPIGFASWEDGPVTALEKWLDERAALLAGRTPRTNPTTLTVHDLCNAYLNHQANLRDAGELSPRTWITYCDVCDVINGKFGKKRCWVAKVL